MATVMLGAGVYVLDIRGTDGDAATAGDLDIASSAPIIGADVVELNPRRDVNGVTAMVAAKMVKEIAGKIAI